MRTVGQVAKWVKHNLFSFGKCNNRFLNTILNTINYYQKKFGINKY